MTLCKGVDLLWLLDIIDRLPIRYVRDRVVFKHPDARIIAFFRGTSVPCEIDGGATCKAGQLLYVEQWWCCGEYGCANPDGNEGKKRKTKSSRCGARMRVRVFASAERGRCIVQVNEDQGVMHGDDFVLPERTPLGRYDYRSKVIIAEALADGVDHISDVLADERWDPKRIPRPATRKEKDSLRNRFNQLLRKQGGKPRPRQRYQDEFMSDDADESAVEREEAEASDGGDDQTVVMTESHE